MSKSKQTTIDHYIKPLFLYDYGMFILRKEFDSDSRTHNHTHSKMKLENIMNPHEIVDLIYDITMIFFFFTLSNRIFLSWEITRLTLNTKGS